MGTDVYWGDDAMGIIFIFSIYSKRKSLSWWAWEGDPDMSHAGSIFLLEMLLSHRQMAICEQSPVSLAQCLQRPCKQVGALTLRRSRAAEGRAPSACLWPREDSGDRHPRGDAKDGHPRGDAKVLWHGITLSSGTASLSCTAAPLFRFLFCKYIYIYEESRKVRKSGVCTLGPWATFWRKKKIQLFQCPRWHLEPLV